MYSSANTVREREQLLSLWKSLKISLGFGEVSLRTVALFSSCFPPLCSSSALSIQSGGHFNFTSEPRSADLRHSAARSWEALTLFVTEEGRKRETESKKEEEFSSKSGGSLPFWTPHCEKESYGTEGWNVDMDFFV